MKPMELEVLDNGMYFMSGRKTETLPKLPLLETIAGRRVGGLSRGEDGFAWA